MNIVQQGYKAGIKLFSVASSITACISSDEPFRKLTEKDWNKATQEQALDGTRDAYYVYFASKGLAEKALRAFGEEHKEITIVTCEFSCRYPWLTGIDHSISESAVLRRSLCARADHFSWGCRRVEHKSGAL